MPNLNMCLSNTMLLNKIFVSFGKVVNLSFFIFILLFVLPQLNAQRAEFLRGADGSVLDQAEQSGGIYFEDGVETDAYEIFEKNGINNIRLKLWHTPQEPYNGLDRVLAMATRIKALGLGLTIDFHYSDTWADPGHQTKPAAWSDAQFSILTDSIRQYTRNVISRLKLQNTLPDYVQVGNEITCGMLWDDGRVCNPFDTDTQWNKLGILIKNAIQGINEAITPEDTVKVIIHFADGGNNSACRWFFDNIQEQNINFDIIGLSFYPWWHGNFSDLKFNLDDLAIRYGKEIVIVETAYPWTLAWNDNTNNIVGSEDQLLEGYPATVDGQYRFLRDEIELIKSTAGGKGVGIIYWSPEWISTPLWGSPWENVSLFNFDNEVLESIQAFDDNTGVFNPTGNNINLSNHPNPFHKETGISFTLLNPGIVEVDIYNMFGKLISNIPKSEFTTGKHEILWANENLPPGIYLLKVTIDNLEHKHMMLKTQ